MVPWVLEMNSRITTLEACQILFRGQSNVKVMANRLEISLEEMQEVFGLYCEHNLIDENVWQGDVEPSWPYA